MEWQQGYTLVSFDWSKRDTVAANSPRKVLRLSLWARRSSREPNDDESPHPLPMAQRDAAPQTATATTRLKNRPILRLAAAVLELFPVMREEVKSCLEEGHTEG